MKGRNITSLFKLSSSYYRIFGNDVPPRRESEKRAWEPPSRYWASRESQTTHVKYLIQRA